MGKGSSKPTPSGGQSIQELLNASLNAVPGFAGAQADAEERFGPRIGAARRRQQEAADPELFRLKNRAAEVARLGLGGLDAESFGSSEAGKGFEQFFESQEASKGRSLGQTGSVNVARKMFDMMENVRNMRLGQAGALLNFMPQISLGDPTALFSQVAPTAIQSGALLSSQAANRAAQAPGSMLGQLGGIFGGSAAGGLGSTIGGGIGSMFGPLGTMAGNTLGGLFDQQTPKAVTQTSTDRYGTSFIKQ